MAVTTFHDFPLASRDRAAKFAAVGFSEELLYQRAIATSCAVPQGSGLPGTVRKDSFGPRRR